MNSLTHIVFQRVSYVAYILLTFAFAAKLLGLITTGVFFELAALIITVVFTYLYFTTEERKSIDIIVRTEDVERIKIRLHELGFKKHVQIMNRDIYKKHVGFFKSLRATIERDNQVSVLSYPKILDSEFQKFSYY